jgi:hypothetical protein
MTEHDYRALNIYFGQSLSVFEEGGITHRNKMHVESLHVLAIEDTVLFICTEAKSTT